MVTMNGEDSSAGGILPTPPNHLDEHSLDENDDDDMSDGSDSNFQDCKDLMTATMEDEVTAQLAAAGPVGMAAAAAIASAKKRKRPHQFETNPSIRKRQQTRLLRKLRQTIDEFTIRVGMQAIVLVTIPGKPQNSFKCFGAKPLEDVIRNLRPVVMQELENALAQHAPAPAPEDPTLHELPPLVIDGIPTPVEKMTQAQLRAFIPLMLKYSTGRGKPGWGKESTRPPWWPQDLPWANVRMDARTEDEKQKVSWTHALRQIVINCYKYHGREDLLPVFNGESDDQDVKPIITKIQKVHQFPSTGTILQTISNPDGTVSIIQVDSGNSFIQLPDGTHAQVQGVLQHTGDGGQTLGEGGNNEMPVAVDLNSVAQATLGQEGQIILTGEDGHAYPVTVSGMITVPVPPSMYQTVVANISSLQAQTSDGTLQTMPKYVVDTPIITTIPQPPIPLPLPLPPPRKDRFLRITPLPSSAPYSVVTPMVLPKVEPGTEGTEQTMTTAIPVSALTGDPTQTQVVHVNANGQVVHNDKVYQICEFLKPDNQEKVIMMAEVTNHHQHQHQHQPPTTQHQPQQTHQIQIQTHHHHHQHQPHPQEQQESQEEGEEPMEESHEEEDGEEGEEEEQEHEGEGTEENGEDQDQGGVVEDDQGDGDEGGGTES